MFSKFDWKIIIRLLFSFILLAWFLVKVDWDNMISAFSQISYLWLLAGIISIFLAVVVSVIKWRTILNAQGIVISWLELWRAYWAGLFFNNFLPSSIGGDALRIIWVRRITGDGAGATASVVIERILATAGLALVGLIACLFVVGSRLEILILFFGLVVISFTLTGLLMCGRLPEFLERMDNKIGRFIKGISYHGSSIRANPKAILLATLWSMVFQICVVFVNYFIFIGLNINNVNLMDAMYIIPATSVAAMLPLGINGYGMREGAYIALLASYDVSAVTAFAASVIFAFAVSICSLWGGWIWFHNNSLRTEAKANVGIKGFKCS